VRIAALTRALPTLFVAIALAACGPAPAPAATADPTTAPSPTPAAPAGNAFAFNGVEVTIPTAVASGASGKIVAASRGEDLPEFAINPPYSEIKLTGYPAQNDYFQGMIQVFPVADYEQISQVAGQRVQAMQALLAQKPAAPDQEMPVLPVYNAAQILRAQVQYASFQNGAGVRFVTMYSQGLMPATNKEVFYTYQGLTSDGAYWVSAILPVNAAFLPADSNSAGNPPAGGVPFPVNPGEAQAKAYYQAVADRMHATAASQFTPSLEALDAMMQSLRVTAP
jgi:hypothetical protein